MDLQIWLYLVETEYGMLLLISEEGLHWPGLRGACREDRIAFVDIVLNQVIDIVVRVSYAIWTLCIKEAYGRSHQVREEMELD